MICRREDVTGMPQGQGMVTILIIPHHINLITETVRRTIKVPVVGIINRAHPVTDIIDPIQI